MNEYDIIVKSKMPYNLYDKNQYVYIIIKSERDTAIPLTQFTDV